MAGEFNLTCGDDPEVQHHIGLLQGISSASGENVQRVRQNADAQREMAFDMGARKDRHRLNG